MDLTTRKEADVLIVRFAEEGPLEAGNIDTFKETMDNLMKDNTKLLIDMRNLTFMDSVGLTALIAIWRHLSSVNGEVKLYGIAPSPWSAFERTRMDKVFEVFDTEEEALASY